MIVDMPDMAVIPYKVIRQYLHPGVVVFFSQDTSGFKKITNFVQWRIKRVTGHECTHVGIVDVVYGRRVLIEAAPKGVQVGPLSAVIGDGETVDGRYVAPRDARIYLAEFKFSKGEFAAKRAWNNMALGYDYLDIAALKLGIKRSNIKRYICSELVAEALVDSGVALEKPEAGVHVPGDLVESTECVMRWRIH